ncbi:NAD-dependent succinate-semialdehyde dehydrogenase [Vitiosangium sp. GDMCC 1.1324]|uniref:NAD-dependent succinate-semialdehyde dehydrogenase n=1 Tax=Vitiosangium sp. (strain GDMCC 1.1324) TaxID=2138576 RepID=UPI000D3BF449|nr:NAD-dependent succinate-semialdehyde dehydrogenase [Vitiosangium sp. GDMCC 1.1324]PTL79897.1 NADP-dependent succinic semialdehyde dehydrogenase [Vitiosangium sp. GDMCC 1.1324]
MAFATVDPTTGRTLRTFPPHSEEEVETRLRMAVETFHTYRHTAFAERAGWMRRAAELLEAEAERYGRMMMEEMGKPLEAARAEAQKCATACRYYADHAERFLADEPVDTPPDTSFVRYQPLGPVLAIMPWNFPFWQVVRFAAPALMAGNVGLLKHAHNVPECALALEELFVRAGFPKGAFQTLLVDVAAVRRIIEDPRVKAVTLTGSEGAGRDVGQRAGQQLKKVVLELGGSDPCVVLPSANLDAAVETAVKARLINNGQSCIAAKRFIATEPIYAEFERRFVERMRRAVVGDPKDAKTEVGPLAMESIRDGLHAQVERSVAAGAKLLLGGLKPTGPGFWYPPTVLANPPPGSPAYREEMFGPVAVLFRAKDAQDALRIANDSPYGLGSAVWTRDEAEQQLFIDGLEAGTVFVNGMVASDTRLPFGGVKASGHGRELSRHGILEFLNIKTVRRVSPASTPPGKTPAQANE